MMSNCWRRLRSPYRGQPQSQPVPMSVDQASSYNYLLWGPSWSLLWRRVVWDVQAGECSASSLILSHRQVPQWSS